MQRTYTYGNALVSQNQLGSGQTSFYGSDAHGSVRLLSNNAGTVTDAYDYDAFGNLVSASGNTANDYLYNGERFDSDLGSYYLRSRYYSPQRGRFLTGDTFDGLLTKPRTLHKYLYVGADPVNLIDPSGLTETTEYRLHITRLRLRVKTVLCTALDVVSNNAESPEIALGTAAAQLAFCQCAGKGEELLKRSGKGPENAKRLEKLAEESLANSEEGIHGISVTAGTPRYEPFKEVPRSEIEKHFPVHDTPLPDDPLHRTVELPHPVTQDIALLWNIVWGFKKCK